MAAITERMTATERRTALVLSGVFSTRMLGLFMVLPVFSLYARDLVGYTPILAGWAFGLYGLTQSLLQIPMGRLSDRIGRRPVILGGLVMFAIGSVIAALSHHIYGVMLGRALQGTGAIAGAVMALAADLSREEHRLKVMALIGGSIGASFALAIVLGPVLNGWIGVPGIFWVTAGLAIGALGLVQWYIPQNTVQSFHRDTEVEWAWLGRVLGDGQLMRLNLGVLLLHCIVTATFFSLPLVMVDQYHFASKAHWQVYLPALLVSIVVVLPFIFLGERRRMLKQVFLFAVLTLLIAALGLWKFAGLHWAALVAGVFAFFTGFNLLEASLPSLVAKYAPAAHRGTAMGVFTTFQFFGAFLGTVSAGWVSGHYGPLAVFGFNGVLTLLWFGLALGMRQPPYLSSQLLQVGVHSQEEAHQLAQQLLSVPGVAEALVIPEDGVAYLKVDNKALDKKALYAYSLAPTQS
ncbi:MAG: MFS transporter [Gammaproteobacteria bacterium]|nr:MFS transporter [Gammaproteobacteria bacterium]